MVREANMKQAASEKQLKEARGKVRPPPAQACSELPPASQPASPAFPPTQSDPQMAWWGPQGWANRGPEGWGRGDTAEIPLHHRDLSGAGDF